VDVRAILVRTWGAPALRRVAAGVCLVATVAGRPVAAQEVGIAPRLRTGDQFRLEVVHTRENSSRPQQNGKSTTPIDVRVLTAADFMLLDWTPGPTVFDGSQIAQDPLVVGAASALNGMILRVALKGDGEFAGLINAEEIAPRLQGAVDSIITGLAARLPAAQQKSFRDLVSQFLSPAVVLESATRDAQMFFGLNGLMVSVGNDVEARIDLANPLGAGSIPATVRIRAESATNDSAVLSTKTTYDSAALLKFTQALAAQSGAGAAAGEIAKVDSLEMNEDGRYVLDRSLGLMREVVVSRRVVAGPERRLDRWEIRLLTAPRR
jgi:hypothetical protein